MFINDFKIIRILKFLISKVWFPVFKLQYRICNKLKNNKKKIRLFTTTGNISLINVLAIINEIGEFDKYEDILFVEPGKGREEFVKKTLQIANLHRFKKIIFAIGIRVSSELIINNLVNVDEIYLLNHPVFMEPILKIYDKTPIILTDEGVASLINYNSDKIGNLIKFKTQKYLGKCDIYGLKDVSKIKFENIDIGEFQKIANTISEKYPILTPYNKEDKNILYCGIFWEVSGLDRETFVKEQKQLILNLLDAGYKVLYKPHPRDTEFYGLENNPDITFVKSYLPVELYSWDVLAVVSMSSTASINLAHFSGIPGFSNVTEDVIKNDGTNAKLNLCRAMVGEYAPNYKELLKLDVKKLSKPDLKKKICDMYTDYISKKPLLSENEYLLNKYQNL